MKIIMKHYYFELIKFSLYTKSDSTYLVKD